jgi:Leucine-rich repeat (LRR) protein
MTGIPTQTGAPLSAPTGLTESGAKDLFADLPRLSSLDLSYFRADQYAAGMLSKSTLRHLSLRNTRLDKVTAEIKSLVNVEVLDLKGNALITRLEADAFRTLSKLRIL